MLANERIRNVLSGYPAVSHDQSELARLQEFLQRMKEAGVVRTRQYDLPQPDTLGRSFANMPFSQAAQP